jgi:hypothetical protein
VKNYNKALLIILLLSVCILSCKKKEEGEDYSKVRGNYFSIRQFALDEWNTFQGEPMVIVKTVKTNGKTDSSYTNSDTLNWNPIFETFFKTDISDRKFLGKYNFNQFDDNVDQTHNFFYQAIDRDEYTQKLLITIDQQTQKVTGIYIETLEHTFWDDKIQKLFYSPMKTIQIQTDDKPKFGSKKYSVLQYDMMR